MRHGFRVPSVNMVLTSTFRLAELTGRIVGVEVAAFGAERTSATRQLFWNLTIDFKGDIAAMTASADGHGSPWIV